MQESTQKEKVLKKVRNALIHESPNPWADVDNDSPVFKKIEDLDISFAENFTNVGGMFIFCENENDFLENFALAAQNFNWESFICKQNEILDLLKPLNLNIGSNDAILNKVSASIISCESLVARTGSITVSSKQLLGRKVAAYPPVILVVAYTSQLVAEIKDALNDIRKKYDNRLPSMINFITGPSRVNTIETTMVIGADGPSKVVLFLIDNQAS